MTDKVEALVQLLRETDPGPSSSPSDFALTISGGSREAITGTALYLLPSEEYEPGFRLSPIAEFAAVQEPGAEPLLVSAEGESVLAVDGVWIDFGTGGAGKTTLIVDQCLHFAAGNSWHGMLTPARPLRILFIEAEGPRQPFREKLRKRLEAWEGEAPGDDFQVLEEPWAALTLLNPAHRQLLAEAIDAEGFDLVVIGPLRTIGMKGGGTQDEIEEFMALIDDVRSKTERKVAFRIVHHENRAGQISGAWEGVPDVLAHVQAQGQRSLRVYWQKVRWASSLHLTTTHLLWGSDDGFTFEVVDKPEITEATIAEELIAAVTDNPGGSWTSVRPLVRGNDADKARVRDRLIAEGRLLNAAKREGTFALWLDDDPAAPRANASTELAR